MVNNKMKTYGEESSVIRQLFEYGQIRKQEIGKDNVFDFSIGNPNVSAPQIVKDTLVNLLENESPVKVHSYTSANGLYDIRKSIANYLNEKYQVNEDADNIYITCGASAAITISLNALLNENEEVIVLVPYFPEYKVFIEKAKGKCIEVLNDQNTFLPDLKRIEKAINSKTKAIIINSPNNPTGVVYDEKVIIGLTNLLKQKEIEYKHPIYLLSDEPYRELVYEKFEYPFITRYYNNSLVLYSFSKSLSLPGERIGYILVSSKCEDLKDVVNAIKGSGRALGFVCAPSLLQHMIPNCLGKTSDLNIYKENRDILYENLTAMGYEFARPGGAFYLYMKSLDPDANKFSEVAKKFELLIVPSDSFGSKGYVRISYCVTKKQILDSIPAFLKLMQYYKGE